MRKTAAISQTSTSVGLPRGWAILGLALASWVLVGGMWAAASQLYGFVTAAL